MALPNIPPISLSLVRSEFSAPTNTPLSMYIRGGTYVPNIPANSGVPTTVPISLTDLLGASASTAPGLSAAASPAYVYGSGGTNSLVISTSSSVTVSGGTGTISYLWEKVSGSGTVTSPTSASTTFRFSSGSSSGDYYGSFRCKVTRGGVVVYTNTVEATFSVTSDPGLSASLFPEEVYGEGDVSSSITTNSTTVSVSGGSGSISYIWEKVSGSGTITSPTSPTTSFNLSAGPVPGDFYGTFRCKVTRGSDVVYTNTVTAHFKSIEDVPDLTATIHPSSLQASGIAPSALTSGPATVTVTGGSGAISYQWERVSGSGAILSPNSSSTSFRLSYTEGNLGPIGGVFRCKVTRGPSTVYTSTVSVQFTWTLAPLEVVLDTYQLYGWARSPGSLVTVGPVTATVINGSSPTSFYWISNNSSSGITATSPNSSSTTFRGSAPPDRTDSFFCRVVSGGRVADSDPVYISIIYIPDE